MRYINDIIVHCTDTPAAMGVTVEDIRRWHLARGFRDIGYHYVVYRDGSVHYGRKVTYAGAHCKGHNAHSIGVCWVGGHGEDAKQPIYEDNRTEAQKESLKKLLGDLVKMYHCKIHGHRDYAPKACPCYDVHAEYDNICRQLLGW